MQQHLNHSTDKYISRTSINEIQNLQLLMHITINIDNYNFVVLFYFKCVSNGTQTTLSFVSANKIVIEQDLHGIQVY